MSCSKWIKHQVLLSIEEMCLLFSEIAPFEIFCVCEPVTENTMQIARENFLQTYADYVLMLKTGKLPQEGDFRKMFSSVFTTTREALYAMPVGQERFLVKTIKPVIQLQLHHFFVSTIDGKFHPMVLGKESISWGIQFSYPQIYQDPETRAYSKVDSSEKFPNTELFHKLVKWLRRNTMPTPFIFQDKKTHVPIRLGRTSLEWVKHHIGLSAQGVTLG